MQLPILDKAYMGQSAAFESSRTVNLYVELADGPDSKGVGKLIGTPGTKFLGNIGNGPARGLYSFNGELFGVFQSDFVTVDTSVYPWKVKNVLGSLNSSTSNVVIRDNGLLASGIGGNQLIIVDGTSGYIFNVVTRVFSVIPSQTFKPIDVDYIDGYFIVIGDSMQVAASNLYDGTTFNGLAVASVVGTSSKLKAVKCTNETIYFIKEDSIELWQNIGVPTSQGFPFQRISGAVINYGTMASYSWSKVGTELYGVGGIKTDSGVQFDGVVKINGYVPTVISSPAIRFVMMATPDNLKECFSYVYEEDGHIFYVLTNPVNNWTFVYDVEEDFWHERSTYVDNPYIIGRHMANCYVLYNGMNIIGDVNGNLYDMAANYKTDAGLPVCSLRTLQPVFDKKDLKPFSISELTIDAEVGVGTESTPTPAIAQCFVSGGNITAVALLDGGADYNQTPTITAIPVDGQGSGASFTAIVANGSVQSITINAAGSGYTFAPQLVFSGPVITPSLVLSWSNDGAKTWTNEYYRPLGAEGARIPAPHWNRIGYADNSTIFRILCSDACKKTLMGAYVE